MKKVPDPFLRVVSGAVLLVAVVGAVWFLAPIYLLGVALVVALLAFREYADLAERTGVRVSKPAAGMATALACIVIAMPGLPVEVVVLTAMLGLSAVVLASATVGREALHEVSVSVFAPVYIGFPLGALTAIRWTLGREPALLLIATVAASDTAQYYSGRLVGRRPLAPIISPKKTIEGAAGGFVGGALAMAVIGAWWLPEFSLPFRVALGLAVVAVGIVGDLFESLIKRSVGVKDASTLIPGHGGVLDRIDALLFAAPVFYIFVRYGF